MKKGLKGKDGRSLDDYEHREVGAVAGGKKAMSQGAKKKSRKVVSGFFSDLYESQFYPRHYSWSTNDSQGTKMLIAEWMNDFSTIGIDGVAMNANDWAVWGFAYPDQMMVYTACQEHLENPKVFGQLMGGVNKGMRLASLEGIVPSTEPVIEAGKFETASVEECVHGIEQAFSAFGFVEKGHVHIVEGEKKKLKINAISPGYKIIGFKSSGLHSNGYTAARHMLLSPDVEEREKYKSAYNGRFLLSDRPCKADGDGRTLGEILLEPTTIYTRAMAKIAWTYPSAFGINITGNGLENFNRIKAPGMCFNITDPFEPQPVFRLIQEEMMRAAKDGKIEAKKVYDARTMHRKFNMGLGFCAVVHPQYADGACRLAFEEGIIAKVIGGVSGGTGEKEVMTRLSRDGKLVAEFKGYMQK